MSLSSPPCATRPREFARAIPYQCGSTGAPFQQQAAASERPREQEAQQARPEEGRSRRQAPHLGQTFCERDVQSQEITARREKHRQVRIVDAREG